MKCHVKIENQQIKHKSFLKRPLIEMILEADDKYKHIVDIKSVHSYRFHINVHN